MAAAHTPVSVIVHTLNAAVTLPKLLESVSWAAEIIVVDMKSSDDTIAIARAGGATVLTVEPHPRVDGVRNRFLDRAAHEWILVLDADESLAADAGRTVEELIERHGTDHDAFAIPRYNSIGSHTMRGSGWYPDRQIRLFRKGTVRWGDTIHQMAEVITGRDRLLLLDPPNCLHIHHDNYADIEDFIRRQVAYAFSDTYPNEPAAFAMEDYVLAALEEIEMRKDAESDGDLSHALALIMGWQTIIRGLIHWNRLSPRPPLPDIYSLPIVLTGSDSAGPADEAAGGTSEPAAAGGDPGRRSVFRRWFAGRGAS